MRWMSWRKTFVFVTLAAALSLVFVLPPRETAARVRLENICTVYGQQEHKLIGTGLVVGLKGTGDGGDNATAMRALAAALKLMNSPVLQITELKDADNVAMVWIEATVPRTGLRRGQKIDCYVSSMLGAKSLEGGRLLVAPVETSEIGDDTVVGLASGPIYIEDRKVPTSGTIPGGIVLEEDFVSLFVDKSQGDVITLLLDAGHSSFHAAAEVAQVINTEFEFEAGIKLAKATGPGVVELQVPKQYLDSPVLFVADVLQIGLENPHTQGRVVINAKTGTVIVTGEVEISPVVISHKNLTVEVGGAGGVTGGPSAGSWVPVPKLDQENRQTSRELKTLVDALDQLKVPTGDIISIIRELHRSGKLHAAYDEH